jgi:hypothetical protein
MKLIIEGRTVANVTVRDIRVWARIIEQLDGSSVTIRDIRVWAAAHGVDIVGTVTNPRRLAQVQGLPILKQYVGPFWMGNDTVRYAPRMRLKRRGMVSDDAHGRLDPHVAYWSPERAQIFVSMFHPGRKATPAMLEALRQASRELHERHGLQGVHYEAGQESEEHEATERKLIGRLAQHAKSGAERKTIRELQALERANDAPSAAPAI